MQRKIYTTNKQIQTFFLAKTQTSTTGAWLFAKKSLNQVRGIAGALLLRHFSYNENLTRALNTASLKCHQLTLLTGGEKKSRMRMKVQGRLMQVRFIEIHHIFHEKKI